MKKISASLLALLILITASAFCGCQKNKESSSALPNALTDEQIEEYRPKIETLIKKFFDSYEEVNYAKFCEVYAPFYIDAYEFLAQYNQYDDPAEYFETSDCSYYTKRFGKNFTIEPTFNSIKEMSAQEVMNGIENISEVFSIEAPEITRAFAVNITENCAGNSGSESETYDITVLEIGEKLYLYSQYFEEISVQRAS